jgi:dTDP-glucose pyrophosphorylase
MIDWPETVLSLDSTVKDAIQNLNHTGARIVLIRDSELNFLGIIVDGDIRRGVLNGVTLIDPVTKIINTDAKVVLPEVSRIDARRLMEDWNLTHLPIVDKAGKLCGLHSLADCHVNAACTNLFVVMAGGFGSRMGPKTKNTPKPMLEVAGKPMLEHLVVQAKRYGFVDFVFSIHYQGEVIEKYFGNGAHLGVQITYLREQHPLGTAGALALLEPVPTEPVVVCNADVISSIDFAAILDYHKNQRSAITVAVQKYELQNPFGVLKISDGQVEEIVEKPVTISMISAGIYVLEPDVIAGIPRDESCDMPNVLQDAISKQLKVIPFQLYEDWLDVGRPSDLNMAEDRTSKL